MYSLKRALKTLNERYVTSIDTYENMQSPPYVQNTVGEIVAV